MNVEFQPAYILHTRAYRDTSLLVDFFTPDFGRLTAVARGVRARKTAKRNLLNPFVKLLISFQGKSDLKLLTQFEPDGLNLPLSANYLYSGFYLNELIVRLLPELDAHSEIFDLYECTLDELHLQSPLEPILRNFEFALLDALGYGIDFFTDAESQLPIEADKFYSLNPTRGFCLDTHFASPHQKIRGAHILAIALKSYGQPDVGKTAKNITRLLLKPLLGKKPLMSRELFLSGQ